MGGIFLTKKETLGYNKPVFFMSDAKTLQKEDVQAPSPMEEETWDEEEEFSKVYQASEDVENDLCTSDFESSDFSDQDES